MDEQGYRDVIEAFCEEREATRNKYLAEGRRDMGPYKRYLSMLASRGVMVGISPTDYVLRQWSTEEIRNKINRYLLKRDVLYILIPDYAPGTSRLHYHGVFLVKDDGQMTRLKRWVMKNIGRMDVQAIQHTEEYSNYCFKIYEDKKTGVIAPFKTNHVIVDRTLQSWRGE